VTDDPNASTPTPTPSAPVRLAGIDEIRDLLVKISRERVLELTFRNGFPEPTAELAEGAIWFVEDVEAWLNEHGDAAADVFKIRTT